ncbi:helix-turn-helix domain-containing protein [Flavobacterium sp. 140616W15]|uniref:helix-turn-helix domain-containing protein n=1 Tax=Flavobacterium sp. 140616W15 TaxID=2478552 RepID=UPI000F0CE360|nr:helix-turn-helix transcriptional regulator [Flavobacterium sp. 140616W15]AYN05483.1 XRE family transcriptional regulator [Flavobacterium sp. 140616W15]
MISEEEYTIRVGIHIRHLRERKKVSQQNLADLCNMPKTSIGRIERAEVSVTLKTLIKIANALEIEPKEFFNF